MGTANSKRVKGCTIPIPADESMPLETTQAVFGSVNWPRPPAVAVAKSYQRSLQLTQQHCEDAEDTEGV